MNDFRVSLPGLVVACLFLTVLVTDSFASEGYFHSGLKWFTKAFTVRYNDSVSEVAAGHLIVVTSSDLVISDVQLRQGIIYQPDFLWVVNDKVPVSKRVHFLDIKQAQSAAYDDRYYSHAA